MILIQILINSAALVYSVLLLAQSQCRPGLVLVYGLDQILLPFLVLSLISVSFKPNKMVL